MAARLTELKKHLDTALRHRVGFLRCHVQGQELDSVILLGLFQLSMFCEAAWGCPWCFGCSQSCLSAWVVGASPLGQGELWGAAIAPAPVFPYQVKGRCRCHLKLRPKTCYLYCSLQKCVRIGRGHTERVFLKEPLAHENKP